jgi:hypothetical protein
LNGVVDDRFDMAAHLLRQAIKAKYRGKSPCCILLGHRPVMFDKVNQSVGELFWCYFVRLSLGGWPRGPIFRPGLGL